jgi:hypothetical protein
LNSLRVNAAFGEAKKMGLTKTALKAVTFFIVK